VWGGWGEERWIKTVGTDPKEESEVDVSPECSLSAYNNKLVGIIWAGMTRPMNFHEEDNEIQEDVLANDDGEEDELVPFHLDVEGKTKVEELWDIYEPISTPKWAPKGKIGGNGAVQWGPTEGIVNRDPFVLLDVDFKEDYTLKKSAQHLQPTEEDDQGEKIEEIHDDSEK